MLAPHLQATTAVWPITPDAPDLLAIVQAQARTIEDQEALIDDYQEVLSDAQAAPPTGATATATGTALALTAIVNGPVLIGSIVTGPGVPAANPPTVPNTIIIGQTSGTAGQAGTYTTNQATTCANAAVLILPGGSASPWPSPQDADTLNLIVQAQTAIIRTQTALLQQYQDLLNTSQTPAP
jgi:TorA maturation chaperone TorD